MKKFSMLLVLLTFVSTAFSQSSKSIERKIACGTVVESKEQVKASRKLSKALAKPDSRNGEEKVTIKGF